MSSILISSAFHCWAAQMSRCMWCLLPSWHLTAGVVTGRGCQHSASCLLLTPQGRASDGQADICMLAHWTSHSFIQRKKDKSIKLQVMLQLTNFFLVYNFLYCPQFFTKRALMESSINWIGMGASFCCTLHATEPFPGGRKMILFIRHGKSSQISWNRGELQSNCAEIRHEAWTSI